MEKILISACLVGDKVRYDGKDNRHALIDELLEYFELVPICPEVEGGLRIPRDPSEIKDDKVISKSGKDVTYNFEKGAERAHNICLYLGIKYAILKDGSPSCAATTIYDGSFTNKKIKGKGITTKYLELKGIRVIPESEIANFLEYYKANL